jgi:sugar phosphate isomerase/epimerase
MGLREAHEPERGSTDHLRVGMTTFGFLYEVTLEGALENIARAGYRQVEIAPVPPHLLATSTDAAGRRRLKKFIDDVGLECVSINPAELNLVSPNAEIRELAVRQYRSCLQLAHDLGAHIQMVVPGRRNALIPMPEADAIDLLKEQVTTLLADAHDTGVTLALETVPFGFIETTSAVAAVVRELDDEMLGIAVDCANTFGKEDIAEGVRLAGSDLLMAQFSDCWRTRWAHTSIGRGEIDFDGFRHALEEIHFAGPCIYELVDGENPTPRIGDDLLTLEGRGWSR